MGKEISTDVEIWTERYRPKEFSDILGNKAIVERVESLVKSKNLPHLMFAGPAGTGKSSLSLIAVKKLFGVNWKENYLELNASDERGIDVIREKVKNFARIKSFSGSFKIIFLDEADALTRDAQHALRRTMENYTRTCRFILSCNYINKIIDPIQSRCSVFKFSLIPKEEIKVLINKIADKEKLNIDDDAVDILYESSNGDCRRIVNMLQASSSICKDIDEKIVQDIISCAKPKDIRQIIESSLFGRFSSSREKLLEVMLNQGLSGIDIIKAMQREVWNISIEDKIKMRIIERLGEIEFRIVEGSDEFIQLESLLASIALLKNA